jgi:protein O-mannosyl-transferase
MHSPGRLDRALPALIVAAVAAAYANALGAAFQFDDWIVIVGEPRVHTLGAWWASLPGIRPLLKLSYAINYALAAGAFGFHAVNVAIHAVNALMVLALLGALARRCGASGDRASLVAAVGALIFALEPVQTEAVTYVSGRSVSLAALFCLASMLAWIGGRPWLRSVVSPALFAAALLAKETSIVVPAAIMLWELSSPERPRVRELAVALRGHLAVAVLAVAAALLSPTYRLLAATSFDTRSIVSNLATQAGAIGYLAGQLVRPDRLNADPAMPVLAGFTPASAGWGILIAGTVALGCALLRRASPIAFGILWFFVWLAPTNSFVPRLDVANDRQLYLALIGPAWMLAWMLHRLSADRRMLVPAIALLALTLGTATCVRNEAYRSETTFWEDVARKSPHNARAFNNLGYAYALARRETEAEAAFETALVLRPDYVKAAVNLRLLREGALASENARP